MKATITQSELLDQSITLLTECRKAMYMMGNPYVDYEVDELRKLYNKMDIFLQNYEWLKKTQRSLEQSQNKEVTNDT